MDNKTLKGLFHLHKESSLYGRYITLKNIYPLIINLPKPYKVDIVGSSVLESPLYTITIGTGSKRILLWSQMHGNESTTTKALFDLFNFFNSNHITAKNILNSCKLKIIPMLNPDGAFTYTRLNANEVDLNRDAQNLTQPESKALRAVFNQFKPNYCFNLHGQRTIYSAGMTSNVATVSFLTPAEDVNRLVTKERTVSMEIISKMNTMLQEELPNQVGIYDDGFNLNCVGDTFQNKEVPTILFEAGHYKDDYEREVVRRFIFQSYITSLNYIALNTITGENHKDYFKIPENKKLFYDVIIRNVIMNFECVDIAIQFEEKLLKNKIFFSPIVQKIERLQSFYGHKEIDAKNNTIFGENNKILMEGDEVGLIMMNNTKILIKSTNNG